MSIHVGRAMRKVPPVIYGLALAAMVLMMTSGQHVFLWLWLGLGVMTLGSGTWLAEKIRGHK